MQTRRLGRAGIHGQRAVPRHDDLRAGDREPDAHAILDRFVDAGGTFIDTADVYSAGVSEEIIGRWLKAAGATTTWSSRRRRASRWATARRPGSRAATCGARSRRTCGAWGRAHRPAPGALLGPEHPDRGDARHLRGPRPRGQDRLRRRLELRGLAPAAHDAPRPRAPPRAARDRSSRSTACSQRGSSGRWRPSASRRASGSCPGRRSAAAGWPASTAAASARRAPRAWARTPAAARRRGTGAARSRPGRCSTSSRDRPRPAAAA
jgi:hypothetical protein